MSNTGKIPVLSSGSDPSPRERSPGDNELSEDVKITVEIIWLDRDPEPAFPAPRPKARTRHAIAVTITVAVLAVFAVTSIGLAFYHLTIEKYALINGAAVVLALSRIVSWYFGSSKSKHRRRH